MESELQDLGPTGLHTVTKRQNPAYDVPFGQMANYGANGSPTVTLTKTLFAAGATTSTKTSSSSSSSPQDGNTIVTSTRMSTIFNTLTVTSTRSLSTSSSTSSQTSADSTTASISATETNSASTATGTFPPDESQSAHSGRVAGSVIGTFAAFGMIGFLVWWFLTKKKGKERLKVSMSLRRRKSSTPKTPQLEEQRMEETRTMMLQRQAELSKSKENVVGAFLATATDHNNPRSVGSETPRRLPAGRPSMIGVAMTSSTPPNTPPLPRSNSQRSNMTTKSSPLSNEPPGRHPNSLMPGPHNAQASGAAKVIKKPAPIVTAYGPAPNGRSPLSPKAMFNAIGNTTNKAWRRASQALSPSAYQRLPSDSHSVFQPKRRDSHKPRNEEMEIGAQTDSKRGWI